RQLAAGQARLPRPGTAGDVRVRVGRRRPPLGRDVGPPRAGRRLDGVTDLVLPGETEAILGGVAASFGRVPLWTVLLVVVAAAIVGDSVGYEVGKKLGPRALEHRWLVKHRDRLEDARAS